VDEPEQLVEPVRQQHVLEMNAAVPAPPPLEEKLADVIADVVALDAKITQLLEPQLVPAM